MNKELEAGIIKVLGDCGIESASRGYTYVMEAVAFLIEEELKVKRTISINNPL